ncbi:unnamed protein product, partial [Mesorhabditis belari]|uniref:G protein-coupled receptor n=1 Tax=Mesorhabditis belari TaxID=2138241 RepID=A0AAF3J5J5_9BILA
MEAIGKYKYIEFYATRNDTIWLSMDIKEMNAQIFGGIVVFGLLAIYLVNLGSALVLFQQLRRQQAQMSESTYKSHTSVLYMLVSQNMYPFLVMMLPVCYTIFAFASDSSFLLASSFYKHVASCGLMIYPAMSCLVSILVMKPYREYVKRKLYGWKVRSVVTTEGNSKQGNLW